MINARLVFRDDAGNLCPPGHIESLEPQQLYSDWAAGKLRRDVAVTLKDPELVATGLRDPTSANFQRVGAEAYFAWSEIDEELSLAPKILAVYKALDPGQQLVTHRGGDDFQDISWHAPDVDLAESTPAFRNKMYATFYPLAVDVAHTADWYDRDPSKVVRDIILDLFKRWTLRDNATVLHLLNTACNVINDIVAFKDFTPSAFQCIHEQVARWKVLATHVLATARVLAQADPAMWEDVAMEPICLGAPHDVTWVDYTKSSRDQKDLFLCGHPSVLGVRGVKTEPHGNPVNHSIVGAPVYGWLWDTYISTQVTNSRAVVAGVLEE